ncbi:MAG: ornithine cyclodeaminase family protein, partial [Dehalococcoidia bacterium]|nr:ornithine cyclodeaminase family protein [Dehalococcoidia bacterium]
LTMKMTMDALEESYTQTITGEAVCRPNIGLHVPTQDPDKTYVYADMNGGSAAGYFAIRMKSDIIYNTEYMGTKTKEKYCVSPGTFCGLIFLFKVDNGEPLALMNDGYLQHMRVGADGGLGVKYMAREDAEVVGMFGSGGMARSHIDAFRLVRNIKKIQVYSPTKAHREAYAREVKEKYGIKTVALDAPEDVYRGADIVASCTDAVIPVVLGKYLEKGTHVRNIAGGLDEEALLKIDRWLRFGNATPPRGQEEITDESLGYVTPQIDKKEESGRSRDEWLDKLSREGKVVYLKDILNKKEKGRTSPQDITFSERGNLQGAQFHAVAGKVYEAAKEKGIGRTLPTEWFLQDIRD